MRILILIVACCFAISSTSAQDLPKKEAWKSFRADVLKTRLVVRNFSADPTLKLAWTSDGLSIPTPKLRTFGVYSFDFASLDKDHIELVGRRSTLVTDGAGKAALMGSVAVTIEIALNGADPALVLPTLKAQLFYPTIGAAIAEIPSSYATLIPKLGDAPVPPPNCLAAGSQYVGPIAIKTAVGWPSPETIISRYSGVVTIVFSVNEDGKTSDLWLARPAGMDLDDAFARAVASYVFKPATCDGVPIRVPLLLQTRYENH